jgi:hypothetical protein
MALLSTKRRNALPKSTFGLPGERKYPMPDAAHAKNAKARASQAVNAGRMSPGVEAKIDSKANKLLGGGHKTQTLSPIKTDRGDFKVKG